MSPERALDLRAKVADLQRTLSDSATDIKDVLNVFIDLLDGKDTLPEETLTLRDHFALAALGGFLADPNVGGSAAKAAKVAYEYADAMLKARK